MLVRSTVLTAALATAVLAGSTATATTPPASTVGRSDKVGDVRYWLSSGPANTFIGKPDRKQGDIKAVRVTHTKYQVRVLVRFRELNKTGQFHAHQIVFQGPQRRRLVYLNASPRHKATHPTGPIDRSKQEYVGGWSGQATLATGGGRAAHCREVHHLDYARNTMLVVLRRACLGNPAWVRVGVRSQLQYAKRQYFDVAYTPTGSMFEDVAPLGPKVYAP